MALRTRRAGPGAGGSAARSTTVRGALVILATLLPLIVAGCGMPAAKSPGSPTRPEVNAAGTSIDIGDGRTLFLACAGEGSPTVILEAGLHESSEAWTESAPIPPASGPDVFSALAEHTRVCRYDRPGTVIVEGESIKLTDRSTPVRNPRTIDQTAADLERLVVAAGLSGPFVLVGHSMGGYMSVYYAQTHPEDVAGIVLVDSFSERMPALMGARWAAYEKVMNGIGGHPLENDPGSEKFDVPASAKLSEAAPTLRQDLPMALLTKTEPFALPPGDLGFTAADLDQAWAKNQQVLGALVPNTPFIFARGSDHNVQVSQPDLVTSAVLLVQQRSRAG